MFLLNISIVIIVLVSDLHAAVEFEFKHQTREEYCRSIARFRNVLSTSANNVPGVRVLPENPTHQITKILLTNEQSNVVHLVMLNKNLYIVGFIANGIFFRFKDHSDVNVEGVQLVNLKLQSNYQDLVRTADKSLEDVEVSREKMEHFITTMFHYGNEGGPSLQDLAQAFLGLAIAIPECLRFSFIQNGICDPSKTYESFRLGSGGVNMVRRWYEYSEFTAILANDREAAETYISLEEERRQSSRMTVYYALAVAIFCQVRDRHPRSIAENSDNAVCPPNTKSELVKVQNTFWSKEDFTLLFLS